MTAWRNWAGDQSCSPAVLARPRSVEEVRAAVGRGARAGHVVRVAGAGHSFTDAVLTEGTLLSLDALDRVLDVDRATGLVRVEAGITLRALSAALWSHGLALENLGDVDVQSVAGAAATATHGTGARLRNLSAAIEAVQLVDGAGAVHELAGDDAARAARVALGALGVVTALTLRARPAFVLRAVEASEPLEDLLADLDAHAAAHDHFELFVFPHARDALTKRNDRVDAAPTPRSRARAWVEDVALANGAFAAACHLGRRVPRLVPALNRALTAGAAARTYVDRSYRVFASPRHVRFTEMEYAVPRERAAEAVRTVKAIAQRPGFSVPFPIEVRFVAADDALLSPASGRDTCYVAVHMFRGMPWEPYFRAVEEALGPLGGRPHWGKRHFQHAATLAPRYPGWAAFAAVRDRLDPDRRFANGHVERVLGP